MIEYQVHMMFNHNADQKWAKMSLHVFSISLQSRILSTKCVDIFWSLYAQHQLVFIRSHFIPNPLISKHLRNKVPEGLLKKLGNRGSNRICCEDFNWIAGQYNQRYGFRHTPTEG